MAAVRPVARVEAVGQVMPTTADRALCLPVQIRLLHATDADLKAALIVQNDLGWTVASADAIFATASQHTSSMVTADDVADRLSAAAAAATARRRAITASFCAFTTRRRTHPAMSRRPIRTISGRDLLLATWTALPGADWSQVERATDLPNVVNLPISGDLTLVAHNLDSGATLANGAEIQAALLVARHGIAARPRTGGRSGRVERSRAAAPERSRRD